jgi:hypothetical protein
MSFVKDTDGDWINLAAIERVTLLHDGRVEMMTPDGTTYFTREFYPVTDEEMSTDVRTRALADKPPPPPKMGD